MCILISETTKDTNAIFFLNYVKIQLNRVIYIFTVMEV